MKRFVLAPTRHASLLLVAPAVLAVSLGACTRSSPRTATDRAAQAACRSRADEIYLRQNRADLYVRDQRDTPQSSYGLSGITTSGLSERYGRDTLVSDCLNAVGTASANGDPSAPAPVTAPAAVTPAATQTRGTPPTAAELSAIPAPGAGSALPPPASLAPVRAQR